MEGLRRKEGSIKVEKITQKAGRIEMNREVYMQVEMVERKVNDFRRKEELLCGKEGLDASGHTINPQDQMASPTKAHMSLGYLS